VLRFSLNDSLLLTVFLPGAIFLLAIGWVVFPYVIVPWDSISGLAQPIATGILAAVAFLLFFLAMFLGSLLGTAVGYVEVHVFDWWQQKKLGIESDDYQKQWERYLDSLEKSHNSYVTKQVNAQFQARSAIALLILFVLTLVSPTRPIILLMVAFSLTIILFKAAVDDHSELAKFRKRRFGVKPDPTAKPEESLGILVDAWCKRAELRPLQIVLTILSPDGKTIKTPYVEAYAALKTVAELPPSEVSPTEKCMVCLAIAALGERMRSAPGSS
jgi:hypothetical protein